MRKLFTGYIATRYIHLLFLFAILLFVTAHTHGQSLTTPMIHKKINCHSTFMIVVNPTIKNQLNPEKKASEKEERKALKKYLRKAKKDFYQNHERFDEKGMVSKGGKAVLKVLFVILGICLVLLLTYILIVLPVKLLIVAIFGL